jgi:hypothetical protein
LRHRLRQGFLITPAEVCQIYARVLPIKYLSIVVENRFGRGYGTLINVCPLDWQFDESIKERGKKVKHTVNIGIIGEFNPNKTSHLIFKNQIEENGNRFDGIS